MPKKKGRAKKPQPNGNNAGTNTAAPKKRYFAKKKKKKTKGNAGGKKNEDKRAELPQPTRHKVRLPRKIKPSTIDISPNVERFELYLSTTQEWLDYLDTYSPTDGWGSKVIALDCEMVGTGTKGKRSVLARVSIVNSSGETLLDTLVAPDCPVTDYRTEFTGVTAGLLENAPAFKNVQETVRRLVRDKIVVGHSVCFDFMALRSQHPACLIRDTADYEPFLDMFHKVPKLRCLASDLLGITIQDGVHNSIEDARVCMILYRIIRDAWELDLHENGFFISYFKPCSTCGEIDHITRRCPENMPIDQPGPSRGDLDDHPVNPNDASFAT